MGIFFLLVAVTINFYEFPKLEESRSSSSWKAIYQHNTSDLIKISFEDNPRLTQRYNPAITLGMISPGSTVILPKSGVTNFDELSAQLISFGKANQIITKSYDPKSILKDFDPTPYITEEGDEDYRYTKWILAVGPNSKNEFILLIWESIDRGITDVLIDTSLLPEKLISELY